MYGPAGAVVGLAALGPRVVCLLLLPHVAVHPTQSLTLPHGPAGAVVGLAALGPGVVRLLLLPHVAPYCAALAPALAPPAGQRASPRATEAAHVFNALAAAAAAAVADLARAWCALSGAMIRALHCAAKVQGLQIRLHFCATEAARVFDAMAAAAAAVVADLARARCGLLWLVQHSALHCA